MNGPSEPDFDLTGITDIHIHAAPDTRPRCADDLELARSAAEAGMKAILLKSHVTMTPDRATIAERSVGGAIRIFGGLALNGPVGGFNPAAVEAAIALGAKQIYMPTFDSAHHQAQRRIPGGLSVFTEGGRIKPEIHEILDMIAAADIMMGTGHLSPPEILAVVKLARQKGLKKIMVTHPEAGFLRLSVEFQQELAREEVFFERCFVATTSVDNEPISLDEIANQIRAVGVETTVLATDFGQERNPLPVEGMRSYLSGLSGCGFTPGELQHMAGDLPASLLEI